MHSQPSLTSNNARKSPSTTNSEPNHPSYGTRSPCKHQQQVLAYIKNHPQPVCRLNLVIIQVRESKRQTPTNHWSAKQNSQRRGLNTLKPWLLGIKSAGSRLKDRSKLKSRKLLPYSPLLDLNLSTNQSRWPTMKQGTNMKSQYSALMIRPPSSL